MNGQTKGGSALRVVAMLQPGILAVGEREDVQENELGFALLYQAASIYLAAYRLNGSTPTPEEFASFARMAYDTADAQMVKHGLLDPSDVPPN